MAYRKMEKRLLRNALSGIKMAVFLDPSNPEWHYELAQVYDDFDVYGVSLPNVKQSTYDLAVEAYQKTIQLKPDFLRPHLSLGLLHHRKGNYELAADNFRDVIKLDSNNMIAYNYLADCNSKVKRTAKIVYSIVNFKYERFDSLANFKSDHFDSLSVDFKGAEFHNEAYFEDTYFHNIAEFTCAEFDSIVNFGSAHFYGPAFFWNVYFYSSVFFLGAHFEKLADFEGAYFHGLAHFGMTHFKDKIVFNSANFDNKIDFREALFDSTASANFTLAEIKDTVFVGIERSFTDVKKSSHLQRYDFMKAKLLPADKRIIPPDN